MTCEDCVDNKMSVFSVLTPDERDRIRKKTTSQDYKKGEIMFKEGDKPTGLIWLSEGKVKIFKEGVGGREQIVRMAKPVGFIGYRALFAEENHTATAVAIEDSIICTIDRETIYKLLRSNAESKSQYHQGICHRTGFFKYTYRYPDTKTYPGKTGRIPHISLRILMDYENDESTIKIYLSREDIANLSNMTTSNAIRTLSTFAGEGVIGIDGRKIKILNLQKLERISELG